MADVMYDPADKPLAAKVTRGNIAVNKPEAVTVTGFEANVNGTGQPVLKLICYPVGKPAFQEALMLTSDHLGALMTAEQYDALPRQEMHSCDVDVELVRVAGFSLNPYRVKAILRGEIVPKQKPEATVPEKKDSEPIYPTDVPDNIDAFLKDAPADDKPICLNEWALDPKKLTAYQERIEYIASEAGIGMKEARGWGLTWFNVPDETRIPMSASDALKFVKSKLPKTIDEQVEDYHNAPEPAPAPAVEIKPKELKPVEKPVQTEASVIIFAKSDIYLTLPSGATVTLSVTLRDGADFAEVKRLIDVYTQMLSLPNVTTARPAPAAQLVAPAPVPQPAAPAPQQTAPANATGERISKVVSGVKVAYDEKGQKNFQLFGKYGDNWGTGPDHTCRKPEEIAAALNVAGVALETLEPGVIVQVTPFTVTWTKGKETKAGSGRFYHDNPTFARN